LVVGENLGFRDYTNRRIVSCRRDHRRRGSHVSRSMTYSSKMTGTSDLSNLSSTCLSKDHAAFFHHACRAKVGRHCRRGYRLQPGVGVEAPICHRLDGDGRSVVVPSPSCAYRLPQAKTLPSLDCDTADRRLMARGYAIEATAVPSPTSTLRWRLRTEFPMIHLWVRSGRRARPGQANLPL